MAEKSTERESAMGFKDKEKALNTLKVLEDRDIIYQYRTISGLVGRAKRVLLITKDTEKLTNLREALKIFEDWLTDYRTNNRAKENLAYLPIETIEAFRTLANKYDLWNDEFYSAYKREKGDYKNLRTAKIPYGDITWDIERNRRLRHIISTIEKKCIPWYETDVGIFRGMPTKEHVQCIMLGYGPHPAKLKGLLAQVNERFGSDRDDTDVEEKQRNRGTKRRFEDSSSNSTSENEPEEKRASQPERVEPETEQNKTTESTLGFKDKEKALRSIKSLDGRDVTYQYHAIAGLVKRAGRVISCTKDEQKIKNMKEAVQIFEDWITDYNLNDRSKENFNYLSVDIVRGYKSLAERYDIEDNSFLEVYEQVDGDYKKLRSVRVPGLNITWDVYRNKNLQELVKVIKENHIECFNTDDEFHGLPTMEHTRCIMWGFGYNVTKLKKLVMQVREELNDNSNGTNVEERKCKGTKRTRRDRSSSDTSSSSNSEADNKNAVNIDINKLAI